MPLPASAGRTARRLAPTVFSLFLSACLRSWDSPDLMRTTADAPAEVSCSACHPYPLKDRNHQFHGVNAPLYQKKVNGPVTCLDCHRSAIRWRAVPLLDSVFQDTNGAVLSSLDFPDEARIRTWTLLRVDTYVQHHPVPSPRAIPAAYGYQEWLTGLAHLDGKVDVEFDSAVSDTVRFHGETARYDPEMQTCSAVSCHPRAGSYRFSACSKGLPEMRGGRNPLASCDTAAP